MCFPHWLLHGTAQDKYMICRKDCWSGVSAAAQGGRSVRCDPAVTYLIDGDGSPHVAPLPCLFLQGLGEPLLCTLLNALRICEGPPFLPIRTSDLRISCC